jgi:hypothetical protein
MYAYIPMYIYTYDMSSKVRGYNTNIHIFKHIYMPLLPGSLTAFSLIPPLLSDDDDAYLIKITTCGLQNPSPYYYEPARKA